MPHILYHKQYSINTIYTVQKVSLLIQCSFSPPSKKLSCKEESIIFFILCLQFIQAFLWKDTQEETFLMKTFSPPCRTKSTDGDARSWSNFFYKEAKLVIRYPETYDLTPAKSTKVGCFQQSPAWFVVFPKFLHKKNMESDQFDFPGILISGYRTRGWKGWNNYPSAVFSVKKNTWKGKEKPDKTSG